MVALRKPALYRELQQMIKLDDPRRATSFVGELLESKELKPLDFSIRQLAEATIEDGREFVELCNPMHESALVEAAGGAVSTATFSNIIGQLVYTTILQAYNDPMFLWPRMVNVNPTPFNGEKIPGIGRMGDDNERVNEAEEYPLVGLTQEYIETPETIKTGMIVPVTKEAIFFDRTNLLLKRAGEVGYWQGLSREKEVMKVVLGVTNNYARNGTASDTYKTSGGHGIVNAHTAALVDWTDINEVFLLFDGMTDFTTGEPILIMPTMLIVPSALLAQANFIMSSTQVRAGTSNSTSSQVVSVDPVRTMFPLEIVSSQIIKSVTSETNDWWVGDPKRAFQLQENWGITTEVQSSNSEMAFRRDIVQAYKVSERSITAVIDPHYMIQSTGGS